MSGALKPSLAWHQIAMVSVQSCPLAPLGSWEYIRISARFSKFSCRSLAEKNVHCRAVQTL